MHRLRLADARLGDGRFLLHDGHGGALAACGRLHGSFASKAPAYHYDLIVLE
jgi:hypothetical protein